MPDRSLFRRLSAANFNLEQFRSELADEVQLLEALPEEVRAEHLREQVQQEQDDATGDQPQGPDGR
ncbi:MAG: hypothetical protein ACYC5Y_02025 [Symbiobacteriia bacterium]